MGKGPEVAVDRDDGGGEEGDEQQLRRDDRQDRATDGEQKRKDPGLVAEDHLGKARQPMSERQKPSGQSRRSITA